MAITAHFLVKVDGSLQQESCMLAFKYAPFSHTGEYLAELFIKIMKDLLITNQVCEYAFLLYNVSQCSLDQCRDIG
jgi:hypothetical protein